MNLEGIFLGMTSHSFKKHGISDERRNEYGEESFALIEPK